nr:MAG TPA: hypothetical protein [Caudoviricetes sp.]
MKGCCLFLVKSCLIVILYTDRTVFEYQVAS